MAGEHDKEGKVGAGADWVGLPNGILVPPRAVPKRGDAVVDLSEDSGFLALLLDDTGAWRSRLRELLEFRSSTHVRVTSEFQIDMAPTLFEGLLDLDEVRSVNLVLPLTTRPKRPMVNERFEGPAGEAQMLRRSATALLQAAYVHELATQSPANGIERVLTMELLRAICVFTPEQYERLADAVGPVAAIQRLFARRPINAVELRLDEVRRWLDILDEPRRILTAALAEGPSSSSSSENLLLALLEYRRVLTPARIEQVVVAYRRALALAQVAGDFELLSAVAEYGRRYEVMLEVELPTAEASTVRMSEDRRLQLEDNGYVHVFRCSDAQSVHLEARIEDPAVALRGLEPVRAIGGVLHPETFEAHRVFDDAAALYTSRRDRPDLVEVLIRLAPSGSVVATAVVLAVLDFIAAVAVVIAPHDSNYVDRIAVLVVPTTLAAAFALIREQTTLASVLLRPARRWLTASIALLWLVVLVELLVFDAPDAASATSAAALH